MTFSLILFQNKQFSHVYEEKDVIKTPSLTFTFFPLSCSKLLKINPKMKKSRGND